MSSFNAPALALPIQPTKQQAASAELRRRALVALQGRDILEFFKATADFEVIVDQFHNTLSTILHQFIADMEAGLMPKIILSAPPRTSKSSMTVHSLVPYLAGLHPEWEAKVITNGQPLADDHGVKIRRIMSSDAYRAIFPNTRVDPDRKAKANMGYVDAKQKPHRGSFMAIGADGSITGMGADLIVYDDPHKNLEEARSQTITQKIYDDFQATVMTRANSPHTGVIVMATRWTELDLTGRILDGPLGKLFKLHIFPAYDEHDVPLVGRLAPIWENAKATMDPKIWNSLFMCLPVAADGDIYKLADLEAGLVDEIPKNVRHYITADPAASSEETSDYWTIHDYAVDSDDNITLVETYHKRGIDSLTFIEALFDMAYRRKPAKIFVERCHASNVLEPIINKTMRERRSYYNFEYPSPGNKNKVSRSQSIAARVRQHKVRFLRGPEIGPLFHELCAFPDGKNDDHCDCFPAGTLIATQRGDVPIEDVTIADHVLTREGYKPVKLAWCKGYRKTITRFGITATPEHKIWTVNRGWIQLDQLLGSDIILTCAKQ